MNAISIVVNLIEEIFGRGYTARYRCFRTKELFSYVLSNYYELTMIPAIVLGCVTSLMIYFSNLLMGSIAVVSASDAASTCLIFLVFMTIVDFSKMVCNCINK